MSQRPSARHGDRGCLSPRRLFHCVCIWERSSRSNFHTQEVQWNASEWNSQQAEGKMVYLQKPEGWELVAVEGEGARRKSRSPPQCRGPVNLVNEKWAPGQMTHLQSSINTAAQGRQGRCYWRPRSPGSAGFVARQWRAEPTVPFSAFIKLRKVPAWAWQRRC